jgi:ribonucleoside-diphosphate reductase alpha chain
LYLVVGRFDDGRVGEVFVCGSKEGDLTRALLDSLATSISIGLQYGVPLEVLATKLVGHSGGPCGGTFGDPDVPMAKSILDYLGQKLLAIAGSPGEKAPGLPQDEPAAQEAPRHPLGFRTPQAGSQGPANRRLCDSCGSYNAIPNGKCVQCPDCFTSSCG